MESLKEDVAAACWLGIRDGVGWAPRAYPLDHLLGCAADPRRRPSGGASDRHRDDDIGGGSVDCAHLEEAVVIALGSNRRGQLLELVGFAQPALELIA
ncbi:MAG: hypothetical protein WEC34_02900 [Acidimicrobiia bacterium]